MIPCLKLLSFCICMLKHTLEIVFEYLQLDHNFFLLIDSIMVYNTLLLTEELNSILIVFGEIFSHNRRIKPKTIIALFVITSLCLLNFEFEAKVTSRSVNSSTRL